VPQSLYDLLPQEAKAAYPPEKLDGPAAAILLRQRVPDGYDPAKGAAIGQALAGVLPKMAGMRAITSRVRAAQQGQLLTGTGNLREFEDEDIQAAENAPEPEPQPPVESATQRLYNAIRPVQVGGGSPRERELGLTREISAQAQQTPLRVAAKAVQGAPNLSPLLPKEKRYTTSNLVPEPKSPEDRLADLLGGFIGFGTTAATLAAIPGASAAGAVGATGALQEGTLKERAVRGTTLAATAGLGHVASEAIAGAAPGAARAIASQVPGAVGFGALQPWAEEMIHRATGERPKPFTGWDAARGTLEMLVANLLTGGHTIAQAARRGPVLDLPTERLPANRALPEAQSPVERQLLGPAPYSRLLESPRGRRPVPPGGNLPSSGEVFTPEANPQRLDRPALGPARPAQPLNVGKVPPAVLERAQMLARDLAPPEGLTTQDAAASKRLSEAVNGVLAGRVVGLTLPGGEGKVPARVGRAMIFRTAAGEDVRLLVQDPAGSPVVVRFQSVADMVKAIRPLSGERAEESRATVGAVREAGAGAQESEIDRRLDALKANEPARSDKGYRRWAQRVARLTAEREALRARPVSAARPAPVAADAETPPDAHTPSALTPQSAAAPRLDLTSEQPRAARAVAKPLEQETLTGMPAPRIPEGAKRSANDESADVIKAMGKEPDAPAPGLFDKPAPEPTAPTSVEAPAGPRGYKPGERVRVPYTGQATAFGRKVTKLTETGTVVGYDDKGNVTIDVDRGKGVVRQTFTEEQVKRQPTATSKDAAEEKRKAAGRKLEQSIRERAAGDPEKARAIADAYQKKADEIRASIGGDMNHPDYPNVRRRWTAAEAVAKRADQIATELENDSGGGGGGDDEASIMRGVGRGSAEFERGGGRARGERTPARETVGLPVRKAAPRIAPTFAERVKRGERGRALLREPAEITDLPGVDVPESPEGKGGAGFLRRRAENIKQLGREITAAANPISLVGRDALDPLFEGKGEIDQHVWEVSREQEATKQDFNRMDVGQRLKYLDDYEHGRPLATPELQAIADQQQQRADDTFAVITQHKPGLAYIEHYMRHLWEKPEQADEVFASLPRRPLEGSKSFLKQRLIPYILDGVKAGLKPVTTNPELIVQSMEYNAAKFHFFQKYIAGEGSVYRDAGLVRVARFGERAGKGSIPSDFTVPDQRWARIFGPPEIPVREFANAGLMDGLEQVAKILGVRHDRKMKLQGGALGLSYTGQSRIETRFATDPMTFAHELSHQMDEKYDLQQTFLRGSNKIVNDEIRALADLRNEGMNPSKSRQRYVRKAEEKMAVLLQAFVSAKELMKETAPITYQKFVRFLNAHDELKPILSIRPSLAYREMENKVSTGGATIVGEYWMQKDLARLLDNWMGADDIRATLGGRTAMDVRNFLNGIQLGMSGFHANNIAYISAVHDLSVGLSQLAHGRVSGLLGVARGGISLAGHAATGLPVLPLSAGRYFAQGQKFWARDPQMAGLARDYFTGGARLLRPEGEHSQFDKMIRYRGEGRKLMALRHVIPALIELPTRVIMAGVERAQVGAFADLYSWELQRNQERLARGETTPTEIARKAVRDVQDRMGQLNYDNLFWNTNLKTAIMLAVRAPGWTLGSARTAGAPLLLDLPRAAAAPFRGEVPNITPRMAYALAFIMAQVGVGGGYHYLHTGRRPETLEDFLHPMNARGERVTFPTDVRTLETWVKALAAIQRGDKDAGSRALRAVLTGPLPRAIDELLNNQTYRGPIRNPKDPAYKQAEGVLKWMFGTLMPISVTQAQQEEGDLATKVERLFGVTKKEPRRGRARAHRKAG
jgi:hypothetical protein